MMRILKTTDLKKYYGSGDAMVRALDGVNLSVEEGEFAAIVGTSGSGKSTLLHMMGGLDRPTSGSVEVAGQKIFELTDDALTIFRRRKIGFVFQSFNLVPVLNVYENIVLPIELRRTLDIAEKDSLEIYVDGASIVLKKYQPACIFCDDAKDVINFKGKNVCPNCIRELMSK